jgi:hypothetical protein
MNTKFKDCEDTKDVIEVLYRETVKMTAIEELIYYASAEDSIVFGYKNVKEGIGLILEDIKNSINDGLDVIYKAGPLPLQGEHKEIPRRAG